jgi:hypothetical protein
VTVNPVIRDSDGMERIASVTSEREMFTFPFQSIQPKINTAVPSGSAV